MQQTPEATKPRTAGQAAAMQARKRSQRRTRTVVAAPRAPQNVAARRSPEVK